MLYQTPFPSNDANLRYQQQCAELGGLVNQLARQLGESKDLNRKLAKELDRVTTDETVMEFVNTVSALPSFQR